MNTLSRSARSAGGCQPRPQREDREMQQFFQLIAGEVSQGRVSERQIKHRLEDLDDLRDQLEEILCGDIQEDDDE